MTTTITATYPLPDLNTLPADIQATMMKVQEKAGFVPNVFLMLARRPDEFRAFIAYHDALVLRKGGLSKGEKEMIIVATSGLNNCLYCVVAHGAILRVYEKSPLISDAIAINHRKANITPRQNAMLDFAMKVAAHSDQVTQVDFDVLKTHGFDDDDIWDIGNITALFALSNRMANVTGLMPNVEFYTMGRNSTKPV
jgi:uncharacterized peroxidase-related enzyme